MAKRKQIDEKKRDQLIQIQHMCVNGDIRLGQAFLRYAAIVRDWDKFSDEFVSAIEKEGRRLCEISRQEDIVDKRKKA